MLANVYIFAKLAMALPLIAFTRDNNPYPTYTAQLIPETLQTLTTNFDPLPLFHPVFVYGSAGKNWLLAALLKYANPGLQDPESLFKCVEGAVDGVYVWPEPVHIGEVTIMLVKLRTPISEDVGYKELRRKVMMGLAMLSSVCCLCENRGQIPTRVAEFMQDYELISKHVQLKISKLSVWVETAYCGTSVFSQLLELHRPVLDAISQTKAAIDPNELLTHIANSQYHEPFLISHRHLFAVRHYWQSFLTWTNFYMVVANVKLNFGAFASKLPDTEDRDLDSKQASNCIGNLPKG